MTTRVVAFTKIAIYKLTRIEKQINLIVYFTVDLTPTGSRNRGICDST